MNQKRNREILTTEIDTLKRELRERKLSLPAHFVRPHQWQIIEELEDKIRGLEEKLKLFESQTPSKELKC